MKYVIFLYEYAVAELDYGNFGSLKIEGNDPSLPEGL